MTLNLERDSRINKHRLDDDCEKHANLYSNYASALADAKANSDAAEDHLKLTKAQIRLDILATTDAAGGKKPTEETLTSMVEIHDTVLAAKERLRMAQSDVYHLEAAVKAMDHRKDQLNNLVHLWSKSYYSKLDGEAAPEGTDIKAKQTRDSLNSKYNKED